MNIQEDTSDFVAEGVFEQHVLEDEEKEALWIVKKINELVAMKIHKDIEGQITYEKIAVLGRNKYVFNPLEKAFETAQVPFFHKIIPWN